MPFNPCSLLTNACLVRLGVDNFQQIQGIIDTCGGIALGLHGLIVGPFFAISSSGKGAGARGLGVLLFIACLIRTGFLGRRACFLLRKDTGGFRLAGELFLTFCLLVDALILFGALLPLGCLKTFLLIPVPQ